MKTILCYISQSEIDEYLLLLQNQETFNTLYEIKKQKNLLDDIITKDINYKLKEIEKLIIEWWEKTTHKYGIPYYVNQDMNLDVTKRAIYILEQNK